MSITYTNITLKCANTQDIARELKNLGRCAFVATTEDGLSIVYEMDSDEGNITTLVTLAETLSEYFGCPALAVQASNEELFQYWLYVGGELLDNYTSSQPLSTRPDQVKKCKAEALSRHFNPDVSSEEIYEILHDHGQDNYVPLAVDRHLSLVELLDLPLCSVGLGFCDLDSGEFPEDLNEEDLIRVDW